MLPVYVSYFAGGGERSGRKTLTCALGFVLGFTLVFCAMGALAGTVGSLLAGHRTVLNVVCGLIVVFFGLSYLGVFRIGLFRGSRIKADTENLGFFSAVLFGIVFSIGWTPCVGAFLGSALMLASQRAHITEGVLMLLTYSVGLGVPFVLSAVLIGYLKSAFDWIKRNYGVINTVCGCLLVLLGILMATGVLNRLLGLLS
ncbi:MAG: cytochrome c biogenesis protein CcdA [Oscillospiraceae bacterium]|nr:cytochrome c biogenesis protein CcdA [Oscillospiraceae bacterium]